MNIIECLEERGLVDAITSDELKKACEKPIRLYIGFDPTADSLHLGNLVGIVILRWFEKFGHTPVVVLGGATARIGDPSGKSIERPLLDVSVIEANVKRIRLNFERVLEKPLYVNNDDWLSRYPLVDFLRDVGKHFRVNVMLTKESVKARLESEEGISFTEFTYQMLQAYDFYHLYKTHNVVLQGGGSDQWGNITAGTDLIRKLLGQPAFGLTFPLLTRSDGKKFGKSETGAIWLSSDRCSPYDFYQYLYRVADADVIKLMKMVTFMEMGEIRAIEKSMQESSYIPNTAQKRLAEELTRMIHGDEGLVQAEAATRAAAPGHETQLSGDVFRQMMSTMPYVELSKNEVEGKRLTEVAVASQLTASKGEASRLIAQGGAYINNRRIDDPHYVVTADDFVEGEFLLLGSGKKKKILLHLKTLA